MSTTGLDVFDTTISKTNAWLNEIARDLGSPDKHRAYRALRAVLHSLRDRLSVNEAAAFGAQLPMLVRGVYYEGWAPGAARERIKDAYDFIAHVEAGLPSQSEPDSPRAIRAVLSVLGRHLSEHELDHVRHLLPRKMTEGLWPAAPVPVPSSQFEAF